MVRLVVNVALPAISHELGGGSGAAVGGRRYLLTLWPLDAPPWLDRCPISLVGSHFKSRLLWALAWLLKDLSSLAPNQ